MADTVERRTETKTNSGLAFLALLVAIVALVVAWLAYNRAGEDLENQASDAVTEVINSEAANEAGEAARDAANEAGEAAQEGADATEEAVDEGPDGTDDGTR